MANEIGGLVTKFAKTERGLIVAIMVIVGLMSGVLSNTGTAAVLIPVVIGIAAKSGFKRSKLLMPLVFAAAMGGNQELAVQLNRPSCQDTGALQFWVKCGTRFPLIDDLEGLLKDAVLQATVDTPLRHNASSQRG